MFDEPIALLQSPCRKCELRHTACWSTCAAYQDYRGSGNFPRSRRENQKVPRGAWRVSWEETQMKKLYKVFISYRQPYKTRRWLLFSADSMEEAVARLQLVAETGIVSYVRIERWDP